MNPKVRQIVLKDTLFAMKKSYAFPTAREWQVSIDKIQQAAEDFSSFRKMNPVPHFRKFMCVWDSGFWLWVAVLRVREGTCADG